MVMPVTLCPIHVSALPWLDTALIVAAGYFITTGGFYPETDLGIPSSSQYAADFLKWCSCSSVLSLSLIQYVSFKYALKKYDAHLSLVSLPLNSHGTQS